MALVNLAKRMQWIEAFYECDYPFYSDLAGLSINVIINMMASSAPEVIPFRHALHQMVSVSLFHMFSPILRLYFVPLPICCLLHLVKFPDIAEPGLIHLIQFHDIALDLHIKALLRRKHLV